MRKHFFKPQHLMKALRIVYTILFVIGFNNSLTAQDTLFFENFDSSPGSKPADWTNLQVKDAKRGMAISHAGVGSHVTSTILMDPDYLLKGDKP